MFRFVLIDQYVDTYILYATTYNTRPCDFYILKYTYLLCINHVEPLAVYLLVCTREIKEL